MGQNVELERRIPFPQANDANKLIRICKLGIKRTINIEDVRDDFKFTQRQAYLYLNACAYLGLVKKESIYKIATYSLTSKGEEIAFGDDFVSNRVLQNAILSKGVLSKVLAYYYLFGNVPSYQVIVRLIVREKEHLHLNEVTLLRRASTLYAWTNWIIANGTETAFILNRRSIIENSQLLNVISFNSKQSHTNTGVHTNRMSHSNTGSC